jgi:hypothetical protein
VVYVIPEERKMRTGQVAKSLRRKAAALQEQVNRMLLAADALEGRMPEAAPVTEPRDPPTVPVPDVTLGRVEQLKMLLRASGPLRRSEILAKAGMPTGTISCILKRNNGFQRDSEGKWSVVS